MKFMIRFSSFGECPIFGPPGFIFADRVVSSLPTERDSLRRCGAETTVQRGDAAMTLDSDRIASLIFLSVRPYSLGLIG